MGDPVLDEIERLAHEAPDNWDSYGAPAVTREAVKRARDSVDAIYWRLADRWISPTAGPDAAGGVELIWKSPRGALHVRVGTGERFKVFTMRGEVLTGPAQLQTLGELIELLKAHLQR